jgi:hypothetical protein
VRAARACGSISQANRPNSGRPGAEPPSAPSELALRARLAPPPPERGEAPSRAKDRPLSGRLPRRMRSTDAGCGAPTPGQAWPRGIRAPTGASSRRPIRKSLLPGGIGTPHAIGRETPVHPCPSKVDKTRAPRPRHPNSRRTDRGDSMNNGRSPVASCIVTHLHTPLSLQRRGMVAAVSPRGGHRSVFTPHTGGPRAPPPGPPPCRRRRGGRFPRSNARVSLR